MPVTIRAGRAVDGAALQDIERRAGARFREVGLADIADHEPASFDELAAYANHGRSWVAVDDSDRAIGYAIVEEVDGNAHIEQVSVVPDRQGMGVGRALVDRVSSWARASGHAAVTLTTFSDVPFNRPLYEHLGFRVLTDAELGPELRALREVEASHGLDPTRECACACCWGPDRLAAVRTQWSSADFDGNYKDRSRQTHRRRLARGRSISEMGPGRVRAAGLRRQAPPEPRDGRCAPAGAVIRRPALLLEQSWLPSPRDLS